MIIMISKYTGKHECFNCNKALGEFPLLFILTSDVESSNGRVMFFLKSKYRFHRRQLVNMFPNPPRPVWHQRFSLTCLMTDVLIH